MIQLKIYLDNWKDEYDSYCACVLLKHIPDYYPENIFALIAAVYVESINQRLTVRYY